MKALRVILCSLAALSAGSGVFADAVTPEHVSEKALPSPAASEEGNRVLTELTRDLSARYRVDGDLVLEFTRAWTTPDTLRGTFSCTVLEAPPALASTLMIRVRLQDAEHAPVENTLILHAQLLREVWVTRVAMSHGEPFDPSQLDTRRIDVLREHDTVAVNDATTDFTFAHGVTAGRVLAWRDLAKRSLVRKGDVIEVSAVDGLLAINMKALAMENGAVGENIRVRNLESKKEFTAQVVGEAHAQIRL